MKTTKKIKGWFDRLFCRHEYAHLSNIYGDMIRYTGWKRSIWKCKKCDKIKYKDNLYNITNEIMENHYLYIEYDKWNWCDGVFSGIATVTPERVSDYCLEQADKMRNSDLGNYDDLTTEQRERLAKFWEAAINLPDGKYEYYFNLEDKREAFIKSVKEIAARLGIDYELIIKD